MHDNICESETNVHSVLPDDLIHTIFSMFHSKCLSLMYFVSNQECK